MRWYNQVTCVAQIWTSQWQQHASFFHVNEKIKTVINQNDKTVGFKGGKTAMKSTETSQTFSFLFFKTRQAALTFRTGHYYQSSVNKHSIGEMLRHTNTGGVSVLYITHFGRERQRGIAAEQTQAQEKEEKR